MAIDKISKILDGILNELNRRNSKVDTFYFTSMDGKNAIGESKSFKNVSDVAMYLHKMSLTHGIFACSVLKSGSISSVLFPLKDYSIVEIDSGVVERFLKMK